LEKKLRDLADRYEAVYKTRPNIFLSGIFKSKKRDEVFLEELVLWKEIVKKLKKYEKTLDEIKEGFDGFWATGEKRIYGLRSWEVKNLRELEKEVNEELEGYKKSRKIGDFEASGNVKKIIKDFLNKEKFEGRAEVKPLLEQIREGMGELKKEKQVHHSHLQELFQILCFTTTNVAPPNLPSDTNTLANLVKEQVVASQTEKENCRRENEQLKEENQQLKNYRTEQEKILTKNNQKITQLEVKISETEQKLAQVREQEAHKTAKIQRIESELAELGNVKKQLETELTQDKQTHFFHLQELFEILRTATDFLNLDSLNGDNITYDLVKEKVQSCQEEKANLWQEIEELETKFQVALGKINNYKIDTNSLKNQWRKTEQELKNSRITRKINLNFFITILNKQKELKKLKDSAKPKLADKNLLKNLLSTQELLTNSQLTNAHQLVINSITTQLTQLQDQLAKKITWEEINQLCQVKHHLVELELELKNLLPVNLEAKVETR
jgi:hypothetical protein